MLLPGRLRSTSLGDLLGQAHRARATGTLELCEENLGRTHRIHFLDGGITAVEVDGASRRLAEVLREEGSIDDATAKRSVLRAMGSRRLLGEVLIRDFAISNAVVGSALRKQLVLRLNVLEKMQDARVTFRVTVRAPREALSEQPLEAKEFLVGKRRAKERTRAHAYASSELTAYRVLGVNEGAPRHEIKRAFRTLALRLHPDLHPQATDQERRSLELQLARVMAAYQSLVA